MRGGDSFILYFALHTHWNNNNVFIEKLHSNTIIPAFSAKSLSNSTEESKRRNQVNHKHLPTLKSLFTNQIICIEENSLIFQYLLFINFSFSSIFHNQPDAVGKTTMYSLNNPPQSLILPHPQTLQYALKLSKKSQLCVTCLSQYVYMHSSIHNYSWTTPFNLVERTDTRSGQHSKK